MEKVWVTEKEALATYPDDYVVLTDPKRIDGEKSWRIIGNDKCEWEAYDIMSREFLPGHRYAVLPGKNLKAKIEAEEEEIEELRRRSEATTK